MGKFWIFVCVTLMTPVCLLGNLFEVKRFVEILPWIDSTTLVLIDLDNTLYESELMLGSASWRSYFRKKMKSLEIPEDQRERMMDDNWDFLQRVVPIRAIDSEAPAIINQLRNQEILVFGFTARAKREIGHTNAQLENLGVQFTPFSVPLFDIPEKEAAFENGVIYCGKFSKAEALTALLNYLQLFDSCCSPDTVLVMDDHEYHVLAVEPIPAAFEMKFIGVRFTGADERCAQFNPEIVEYQWKHLPLLISDKEAAEKLKTQNSGCVKVAS